MDSDDVRREWADRSGEYSPSYYAYYGPNETSEVLRTILERHLDKDAAVLELGCSSGRHLAHLLEHGFEDLTGVEVNGEARAVMADAYPDLAARGTFHFDAIESVVSDFGDDRFDAVFAVETLQHIHPDAEWVFGELARIADGLLVTAENEGAFAPAGAGDVTYVDDDLPLYDRDWRRVFTGLGFAEIDVTTTERDTVRTFRLAKD